MRLEPTGQDLNQSQNPNWDLTSARTQAGTWTHCFLDDALNEVQVPDVSLQKEFSERQSDRYLERCTFHWKNVSKGQSSPREWSRPGKGKEPREKHTSQRSVGPRRRQEAWITVAVFQLLIPVWLFSTPWTAARQPSLPFTVSRSWLKLMSTESVMPSHHLILCPPTSPLSSTFPSIKLFSNEQALCIRWPVRFYELSNFIG